jgi:signal transduction histidine kinase
VGAFRSGRRQGDDLLYHVADTGIGIPKRTEEHFTEFKQVDGDDAGVQRTGLGPLSKKFVEMRRRIWVESELGKGSTFFFSIPLRANDGGTP